MKGLDFVIRQAQELGRPVAVNLSFGNTYGSHDGTSLLETFMNDISNYGRSVLVAGTGNEGTGNGHTAGRLVMGSDTDVELSICLLYTSGFFRCSADRERRVDFVNRGILELFRCADEDEFNALTGSRLGGMILDKDYHHAISECRKQLREGREVLKTEFRAVYKRQHEGYDPFPGVLF